MDFKNIDIATGPVIADLNSADAAVVLEAAATLAVALQSGAILLPTADGQLVLPAGVGLDDIKVSGRDLIIQMPDGTQMVVPDGAIFVPQIVVDGVAVPPLNIAALLIGQEPQPAAGRPQSSGGNFADPVGDIGDPFDLGDLLPPTQLAFPEPEEREIIPALNDEEPVVSIVTPDQPAGSINATASVDEAALPARNSEPSGSNPSSNAETTAGTIVFDAPDGLGSVTLNGVVITAVGQTVVTPLGTLTITSIAAGSIGYSYTLTDNSTAAAPTDIFQVVVTDRDGDTATANLTISIADDVPTARNDTDGVAAGSYAAQTGNVVTGVGTTSGATGADTQGADGAFVSGARAGTATGELSAIGAPIIGQYGTLIINDATGNYTYTRNVGTPGGVNDIFTYQLRDGDGDNSTATLTIAIGDSPAAITFVPAVGEGTIVSEVGLPARGEESPGSNPELPVEATTGTITFSSPDGVASVSLGGTVITPGALPQQVFSDGTGTLVVTAYSFNPATGVGSVTYSYTLTDNTVNSDGTVVSFPIVVVDLDGDQSSPDTLDITILDDAPRADNDFAGLTEGGPSSVTFDVDGNDIAGADGTASRIFSTLTGAYGTITLNEDGTQTYTLSAAGQLAIDALAPGATLTDTFNYTLTDGDGDFDPATLLVTLTGTDDPVVITNLTPSADGGDVTVDEDDLPAGSDTTPESLTQAGDFTISAPDGLNDLTVGTVNVIVDGVYVGGSATTPLGNTLTFTGYDATSGVVSYTYTLTAAETHADAANENSLFENFTVTLTDVDGSTTDGTLSVNIVDDVPTARADVDSVTEDDYSSESESVSADGNVITGTGGSDANVTDGVADTKGADGAAVTAVAFDGTAGAVDGDTDGAYGTLTLNADGSYSYALNNFDGAVQGLDSTETLTEIFNYTITDADGDFRETTLTITIIGSDDGVTITGLSGEGAEETVYEDDLTDGSSPNSGALTQTGSFDLSALDGVSTITVGGQPIFATGAFVPGVTVSTAYGTLTITGFTAIDGADGDVIGGTVAYQYVLSDNTLTHTGPNDSALTDSVAVVVTDTDGTSATDSLDIRVVDDAPTANEDTAGPVAENTPVTVNVIANDIKGADGVNLVTGVVAVEGTLTGTGTLAYNDNGTFTYTPSAGEEGPVSFEYQITDGDGDISTAIVTLDLGEDSVPTLLATDSQVDEEALSDGSNNDSTAETTTGTIAITTGNDSIDSLIIDGVDVTGGGVVVGAYGTLTVTLTDGAYTYSYTLDDNTLDHPINPTTGTSEGVFDDFNITLTDSDGDVETDTITINVLDDGPTAVDDDVTQIFENTPITVDVLFNDIKGADGVAVATVTVVEDSLVGSGTLINNGDGTFTYTPATGEIGAVTFDYTIVDGDGDPSEATVTIILAEDSVPVVKTTTDLTVDEDGLANANVDDAPLATGETNSTESLTASGTAVVNFGSDVPADLLGSIKLVDTPALDTQLQTLGGNAVVFALEVGTGDLVGKDGATEVIRIHITGAETGPTMGDVTYSYSTTLSQPVKHLADGTENSDTLANVTFQVTDSDSDQTTGNFDVIIVDDIPSAVSETPISVAEDAANVGGNVLANDSKGADGATLTSVTIGGVTTAIAAVGTTTVTPASGVGVYQFSANGAWTFNPSTGLNNADGVDASFTYVITDGDGDTATAAQPITITDGAKPGDAGTITLALDDQNLADGSTPAAPPPENDAATLTFVQGSDAISTIVFDTDLTQLNNANLTWTRTDATHIVGKDTGSGVPVVTLELVRSGLTATVTATLNDNYDAHPGLGDILVDLGSVKVVATDIDGDVAFGTVAVTVSDDVPSVTVTGEVPTLTVDETTLADNATASFASVFTTDYQADGPGTTVYSLGIKTGFTGIVDSLALKGVFLVRSPDGVVHGYINLAAAGDPVVIAEVFRVTVDGNGQVTLDQMRSVIHFNGAPTDSTTLAAADFITLTATVTDGDGDTASQTINIAQALVFNDDVPSLDIGKVDNNTVLLTTHDAATIGANSESVSSVEVFGGAFFVNSESFGADGPGVDSDVHGVFSLSLAVAEGTASGLASNGVAINLFVVGGAVIGSTAILEANVNAANTIFSISVTVEDGIVTLTQFAEIDHGLPGVASGYDAQLAVLAPGLVLLSVTGTITDKDGDTASDTETIDLGGNIAFADDGPHAFADTNAVTEGAVITGNVLTDGVNDDAFGADGPATTVPVGGVVGVAAGNNVATPATGNPGTAITTTLGTLTLNADGSYSYDALPNTTSAIITDTFVYTIRDGDGDTSTTTLEITINPVTLDAANQTQTVNEAALDTVLDSADLVVGTVNGSQPSLTTETVVGQLTVSGASGAVTYTAQTVNTAYGRFVLSTDGSYKYTLKAPFDGPTLDNSIVTHPGVESFTYTATDANGNSDTGTITIDVIDDVPTARADTDSVTEDTAPVANGNVLTAAAVATPDTNFTDGVADIQGADGASVTGIVFGSPAGPVAGGVGGAVAGTYGSLTLAAGGGYTYTLTNGNATVQALGVTESLLETFTYTITDGDGDTSTTTLEIRINGTNDAPTIGSVTTAVSEEGLPGGLGDTTGTAPGADTTNSATVTSGLVGAISVGDGDGDALTVTLSTPTTALTSGGVSVTWLLTNGGHTLTGSAGATPVIVVTITDGGLYTVELKAPINHPDNVGTDEATLEDALNLVVPVSVFDGTTTVTNLTALTISIEDDSPLAVTPAGGTVVNAGGQTGSGSLDTVDGDVDNNYGGDGAGRVIFTAATVTSLEAQELTSGNSPLEYFLSANGTVLTAQKDGSGDVVFIMRLQPVGSPDQYTIEMVRPLDAFQDVVFDAAVIDVVGGNGGWAGYVPNGQGNGPGDVPINDNSSDLLVTPLVNGVSTSTINTNANQIGVGGNFVDLNEGVRVDFVTDLTGSPVSGGSGNYSNSAANRAHVFDQHYEVNGASALFTAINTSSTVTLVARDDINPLGSDANDIIGDGTVDNITAIAISFNLTTLLITEAMWIADADKVFSVGGHNFTVNFGATNASVSGVVSGTRIAGFTDTNFSSIEFTNTGGDDFKIGLFSASKIVKEPVDFSVPISITDSDGDTVSSGSIAISATPEITPVVLDLDGDGAEFLALLGGVAFDYNGDGSPSNTAWVGADDGLLAIDANSDGIINDGSEIVFGGNGLTDLQGLAANYDSNHDGQLTAADDNFALFGVWQDANSNGVTDAGEFQSLSDAGIVSIGLVSDGIAYSAAGGEVSVAGQSTYTKADGSNGIVADAAFLTSSAQTRSGDQIRSSNLTTSIVAAALVGLIVDDNPAAAHDDGNDNPGRVLSENGPAGDGFEPVVIADLHDNPVQSAFAPSQDLVQRIGEVESSVRAVDEPDFLAGFHDAPLSQMSELLADSTGPQTPNMASPAFAFGSDSVMHSMLDMAAFAPSIAGNDNLAIPTPVEDALRHAMPDMMIDQLIDSFTGDVGQPANDSYNGSIDGNDLLAGVLDQIVDAFHVSTATNADFFGSHQYDLATSTN